MMTSPTKAGSKPERVTTSRTTKLPNSVALSLDKLPPNLPTPVRAAETITMSCTIFSYETDLLIPYRPIPITPQPWP
jgi:hypothetical protein